MAIFSGGAGAGAGSGPAVLSGAEGAPGPLANYSLACQNADGSAVGYPWCDTSKGVDDRVASLVDALTLEEKLGLMTARESPLGGVDRLHLPELDFGTNCIRSVQSRCGSKCSTHFPSPVSLGATWNADLVQQMAGYISTELRALYMEGVGENHPSGLPHVGLSCWSPTINLNHDPRWGRNFESPSEDPTLLTFYAVRYVKGLQEGEDPRYIKAAATLKHFSVYNVEGNAPGSNYTRFTIDAKVDKRDMAESYWPAFKQAITLGQAKGVMCSYNRVNGIPSCANSELQNLLLRRKWGFNGYITGDSGAVECIYQTHNYTLTPVGGVSAALLAGTDMASSLKMAYYATGSPYQWHLPTALSQGSVQMSDIDRSVSRLLKLRFELGIMDPVDDQPYFKYGPDDIGSPNATAANLQMALESLVLLKNGPSDAPAGVGPDSVLPFSIGDSVAVIGPHAKAQAALMHGYLGQVCPEGEYNFDCLQTPLEAIEAVNANGTTTYAQGCEVLDGTKDFDAAVAAAKAAEKVVLFLGLNKTIEDESRDRSYIGLPQVQKDLAAAVLAVGKPTTVVLFNGGAVAVDTLVDIDHLAILEAWYPSTEGPRAIAQTIFGQNSPGGKMPVTVYPEAYAENVSLEEMSMTKSPGRGYRYYTGDVQYPFGFGLSYTHFEVNLRPENTLGAEPEVIYFSGTEVGPRAPTVVTGAVGETLAPAGGANEVVQIALDIFNRGNYAGAEIIQCFFIPGAGMPGEILPKKVMISFNKGGFDVGGSMTIGFGVPVEFFSTTDSQGDTWVVPGLHTLRVTDGSFNTLERQYQLKTPDGNPVKVFPFDMTPESSPDDP